ncbi:porin [Sphingomonas cavernae]|uniref:Porin n=2 Tax=Sphingomonas cavernae TaxID=2320861 RepID=A0A418WNC0_9SPHN|nr:porin [Sphingomonas cavernae]
MSRLAACAAPLSLLLCSAPAMAGDAVEFDVTYIADLMSVSGNGDGARLSYLDNLDLTATADLDALLDWNGGTAHVHVLNNLGGTPNDRAATLQGVDNIEVGHQRLRVLEAWIEHALGSRTTVRTGLYDLNSEFYANDAAGLLIAPAFGVGSEIAATGPNGPSIFPSTALALRVDQRLGEQGFVRAAVLNASARTLGDPDGVDLSFDNGVLLIGETGISARGKIAAGAWTYSRRYDDIRAINAAGDPVRRRAHGAYIVAEYPLDNPDDVFAMSAFVRAGVSDGRTTPFRGGWQAGLLVAHLFANRPDSAFSIGANQAYLSHGFRRNLRDEGIDAADAETAFEVTYSDRIANFLTLQPDLQLILDPGGDRGRQAAIVSALRMIVAF